MGIIDEQVRATLKESGRGLIYGGGKYGVAIKQAARGSIRTAARVEELKRRALAKKRAILRRKRLEELQRKEEELLRKLQSEEVSTEEKEAYRYELSRIQREKAALSGYERISKELHVEPERVVLQAKDYKEEYDRLLQRKAEAQAKGDKEKEKEIDKALNKLTMEMKKIKVAKEGEPISTIADVVTKPENYSQLKEMVFQADISESIVKESSKSKVKKKVGDYLKLKAISFATKTPGVKHIYDWYTKPEKVEERTLRRRFSRVDEKALDELIAPFKDKRTITPFWLGQKNVSPWFGGSSSKKSKKKRSKKGGSYSFW